MPNNARRAGVKTVGLLSVVVLGAGLLSAAAVAPVAGFFGVATRDATTTFNNLPVQKLGFLPAPSQILDRHGKIIADLYPGSFPGNIFYRSPVHYDKISPYMRKAIVAIEDNRFWSRHGAFDLRATVRAVVATLSRRQVQGGSTLAQQYIKNALELTAKSLAQYGHANYPDLSRKIRELRMAAIVAHQLTKKQLLTAYLNAVPFGHEAVGVQTGANVFFSTTAAKLTLQQAALLAAVVNGPSQYDPKLFPWVARRRRNQVISDMAQYGFITASTAAAAEQTPLGLHWSNHVAQYDGCLGAREAPFFCSYVLEVLRHDPAFKQALYELNRVGGLTIRTTLDPKDQLAAEDAVNFVEPNDPAINPGHNADTEVLIQPGTGQVRAIAVNRRFGPSGRNSTETDYAVNQTYGGGSGVQTGSSSKIFTLLTALKQGMAIGSTIKVASPTTVTGYTDCRGVGAGSYSLINAEGPSKGAYTYNLYNGLALSVNVYFATLEERVGLCRVVQTAASMGMTRVDGRSLFDGEGKRNSQSYIFPADDTPSFTLGTQYVSPMSMAAAYATVADYGVYCHPIGITSITNEAGQKLPVESAHCHRVFSRAVGEAANYIFQGVLTFPNATADNRGINRPAAAKTGTADHGHYAAFAGWTPTLAGYVSVFNPIDPTTAGAMLAPNAGYREVDGSQQSPYQMYGDNAPGATWQLTFLHAALGPPVPFIGLPPNSLFFAYGNGQTAPVGPPKKPKKPKTGPSGPPTGPPTPGPTG